MSNNTKFSLKMTVSRAQMVKMTSVGAQSKAYDPRKKIGLKHFGAKFDWKKLLRKTVIK